MDPGWCSTRAILVVHSLLWYGLGLLPSPPRPPLFCVQLEPPQFSFAILVIELATDIFLEVDRIAGCVLIIFDW